MKLGTFHLHSVPPWTNSYDVIEQQHEQMLMAEKCDFDELWLAEHNAQPYGIIGNAVTTAAALAVETNQIRIGTAVTRLPLHNPLHTAEDLAYVDVLSRGRLDWGIGKGYDPVEFATYGVTFEDREERWQATFEAVLALWESGKTAFKNEYFDFGEGQFLPQLLQRPILPIYIMVSRSDSSVLWAAERLYPVVFGQGPDWEDVKHKVEIYRNKALECGYDGRSIEESISKFWQLKQVHVSSTTERAIAEYKDAFMWYYSLLNNRLMFGFEKDQHSYEWYINHRSVLLGSSEKVLEDLAEYRDFTGIQNVIAYINCGHQPHGQVMHAIEQIGDEVIPKLRSSLNE
jgi:alkanesulfonate monooxygenase SsuD/methylene tetrahydromethanopterin reductase-like flavin-dependent oxidoreductase (luciferase family)